MNQTYRYLISAIVSTLVLILGIKVIQRIVIVSPAAHSPLKTPPEKLIQSSPPRSLTELYQLQNYLKSEVAQLSGRLNWVRLVNASEYEKLIQQRETLLGQIQTLDTQVQINKDAEVRWKKALNLASLAIKTERSRRPSIQTWRQAQLLWNQSLQSLRQIPTNSFLQARAAEKIKLYEKRFAIATTNLKVAQTKVLESILQQSDLSEQATITICKLPQECRHWRGNQPVEKPASLSKIPIALALLHKVATENIKLNTSIYVTPGNFTEDGNAQIQVGQRYPLKTLLMEMITHSSNIASNQLIDYLGWDYINQVLKKRSYRVTRVGSKFIGERVVPANFSKGGSVITSNELTRMMVETYKLQHPGDEVLIDALRHQHNHYLGFSALKKAPAQWLGEKTGETSKIQGTTLAFSLAGETYIVTVIDKRGYRDANIRHCLTQLANYIAQYGYF